MGRSLQHGETLSFRLDPNDKAELARLASDAHKPVGEVLRDAVQDLLKNARRRAYLNRAKQDAAACAALTRSNSNDESRLMSELDALFTPPHDWRA